MFHKSLVCLALLGGFFSLQAMSQETVNQTVSVAELAKIVEASAQATKKSNWARSFISFMPLNRTNAMIDLDLTQEDLAEINTLAVLPYGNWARSFVAEYALRKQLEEVDGPFLEEQLAVIRKYAADNYGGTWARTLMTKHDTRKELETSKKSLNEKLGIAARYGLCDLIEKYLTEGAEINAQIGDSKLTALHEAANSFQATASRAVELLVKNGANVELQDSSGQIALHVIVCNGKQLLQGIKLLASKSNPHQQDLFGRTALHCAVINNNLEALKELLALNPMILIWDRAGKTPLHYTISFYEEAQTMFVLLLEVLKKRGMDASLIANLVQEIEQKAKEAGENVGRVHPLFELIQQNRKTLIDAKESKTENQ